MRLVDRVAYINHDIDDALRAGVLREEELPAEPIAVLGDTGPRRIDALVHDLVEHSEVAGDIVQGDEVGGAMDRAADLHVRPRLPRARSPGASTPRSTASCARCSTTTSTSPTGSPTAAARPTPTLPSASPTGWRA